MINKKLVVAQLFSEVCDLLIRVFLPLIPVEAEKSRPQISTIFEEHHILGQNAVHSFVQPCIPKDYTFHNQPITGDISGLPCFCRKQIREPDPPGWEQLKPWTVKYG
jgi:hypothetical protein